MGDITIIENMFYDFIHQENNCEKKVSLTVIQQCYRVNFNPEANASGFQES